MRIAVIGSGISGLGAAWRLVRDYGADAVTQFEAAPRAGGHAATVTVDYDGRDIAVDTGFIVFNRRNYPLLTALFDELGVASQGSDMGFSLSLDDGAFEWAGQNRAMISSFFAQRRNLFSPRLWRMLLDIKRFGREAVPALERGSLAGLTLGQYIEKAGYSRAFREDYILPMGAAIWSMPTASILDFPAERFVSFFRNHHLLDIAHPEWRTVTGGSITYVDALLKKAGHRVHLSTPVTSINREKDHVSLTVAGGQTQRFDAVVIATHSDQALRMLANPDANQSRLLSAMRYAPNAVYLHRDPRLMPRSRNAWAAWNVLRSAGDADRPVAITYWMNRLQGIDERYPLFVSLNPPQKPRDELTFGTYSYDHPQFDQAAMAAQTEISALDCDRLAFAGAWQGYGFHEDGLASGYRAAEHLIAADRARLSGDIAAFDVAAQ